MPSNATTATLPDLAPVTDTTLRSLALTALADAEDARARELAAKIAAYEDAARDLLSRVLRQRLTITPPCESTYRIEWSWHNLDRPSLAGLEQDRTHITASATIDGLAFDVDLHPRTFKRGDYADLRMVAPCVGCGCGIVVKVTSLLHLGEIVATGPRCHNCQRDDDPTLRAMRDGRDTP